MNAPPMVEVPDQTDTLQIALEELKQKNALFADFQAVQDGNVYCTTNNFFQKSTAIGDFMEDLNMIFQDTEIEEAGYLKKLR